MNVTLTRPMSREQFFDWAEAQDERYEFDGEQPVLMNGGLIGHHRLQARLMFMLLTRLSGQPFDVLGASAGIGTTGQRVRYPDVLVSRGFTPERERLVNDVVAVFEITSPSTSHVDCILKLREYGAIATIRTYAILETESIAVMAFEKQSDGQWTAKPLTVDDSIALPALGIELPLTEIYASFDLD